MKQLIRVLVAEDHPLVRRGLAGLLKQEDDMQVVGEAADGRSAVEMAAKLKPDGVVMDYRMPGTNGLEATQAISSKQPETVVIASSSSDDPYIRLAMEKAGAYGFFLKGGDTSILLNLIREGARFKRENGKLVDGPPRQASLSGSACTAGRCR